MALPNPPQSPDSSKLHYLMYDNATVNTASIWHGVHTETLNSETIGWAAIATHEDGDVDAASQPVVLVAGSDGSNILPIAIDSSGNVQVDIVSGGASGVQYTEGDVDATITGTAILWEDAGDTLRPVSASSPLPVVASGIETILTDKSQFVKITDGTSDATVRNLAANDALNVAIVDAAGDHITSFGGGTQYTEGDVDASITGTALLWEDSGDTLRAVSAASPLPVATGIVQYTEGDTDSTITGFAILHEIGANQLSVVNGNNPLPVDVTNIATDNSLWSFVTQDTFPPSYLVDETAPTNTGEGRLGNARMSPNRSQYTNIRDGLGNERGLAVDANNNIGVVLRDSTGDSAMDDANDAVRVNIVAGAGSGGTASTDDAAFTAGSGLGTPMMGFATTDVVDAGDVGVLAMTVNRALHTTLVDGSGNSVMDDANDAVRVNIIAGAGSGGTAMADDSAFTPAVTQGTPAFAMFDDVSPDSVDEGDAGILRMSANRNLYITLRDAAGNERGVNVSAANALLVDGSGVTQPISAASLPLPSGAATSALQTAGNADLATLAGAVAGTEFQVDILTVPAPLNVVGGGTEATALRVTLASDSTGLLSIDDNGGSLTVDAPVGAPVNVQIGDGTNQASIRNLAANDALNVAIVDAAGGHITSFGGGVQYTEGDTDATITGTALLWEDAADTLSTVSAAKPLPVEIIAGAGSGGTAMTDDAAFTAGTTSITPIGGFYAATRDLVDDGDGGAFAMTQRRAVLTADDLLHSTANSSTTPLIASATFTGSWEPVSEYATIVVTISADVDGTLFVDFSDNGGTNTDYTYSVAFDSGTTPHVYHVPRAAQHARIRYTNGGTGQGTFRLQTHYSAGSTGVDVDNFTWGQRFEAIQIATEGTNSATTALTNNAVWVSGDVWGVGDGGITAMVVRKDARGNLDAGIVDGDYSSLQVNAVGELRVRDDDINTVLTDRSQFVKITDGTTDATVRNLAANDALNVAIVDAAGDHITSFGGGVQYTEGDVDATITGTALLWEDTGNTLRPVSVSTRLPVLGNIDQWGGTTVAPGITAGDAMANPSGPRILSHLVGYNGTSWDRLRSDITNGLDVDVTRIVPGTGATNLGKAEDAPHATGDVGVMALAVRNDTLAVIAGTDGDYVPLSADSRGQLKVIVTTPPTSPTPTSESYGSWKTTKETVTGTSAEVVATPLSSRVKLVLYSDPSNDQAVHYSATNPAVAANHPPLLPGDSKELWVRAGVSVFMIADSGSQSVYVEEYAS